MINDIEELGCRLYIHSNEEEEYLRHKISKMFGGKINLGDIEDEYLNIYFYKNDIFDEKLFSETVEGFVYSRYTAEVCPLHVIIEHLEPVDTEIYLDIVCYIIKSLRDIGCKVSAACEYEDLIVKRTGWNWSEKTPVHPVFPVSI